MSSDVASLHKILKDETRRRIVLMLNEKGALSHSDLMDALGLLTTGLLNYHLKVMEELLAKNEAGQYSLSEKGKVAAKLLLEFPAMQTPGKPKWWRSFWIQTAVAVPIMVAMSLALFFSGITSGQGLYQGLVSIIFIVGFGYMMQHILRDVLSSENKLRVAKSAYILGGVGLGIFIGYFGGGFAMVGISRFLGRNFGPANPFFSFFWSFPYQMFGLLMVPTIGAILMYRFGEKRRFKTANYDPDA